MSQKTYRRQFNQSFDFATFNREVIQSVTQDSQAMIAVMDCSFIPKSGQQTFGLDHFYNGCHSRVEKGLEVSLVAVVDVETEVGYALLAEQTFDQGFCPELTRRQFDEFFRCVVSGFCPLNPPFWGTMNWKFWLEVPQTWGI